MGKKKVVQKGRKASFAKRKPVFEIKGIDLSGSRMNIVALGFTDNPKKARKYYKQQGWTLRHNYSKPFIRIDKVRKK